MSDGTFDDFIKKLDMPEASCEDVHPIVEAFVESVDPSDEDWPGDFGDWMEQANACLASELLDTLGEPPEDPDDLQAHLWSIIRMSWLFYRKYHSGEPFNT